MPSAATLYTMMATHSLLDLRAKYERELRVGNVDRVFAEDRLRQLGAELKKRGHVDTPLGEVVS